MAKEKPTFSTRSAEELYWAVRQFFKLLAIVIACGITLFIAQFFSNVLFLLIAVIGFLLSLATVVYMFGHFIRFFVFKSRGE
ncbi:hypothetical protein [Tumebacillus flagellatus]|uniref:Uncharacterized protein n=1 Tax=Tumebacillus flagellatus TaxID=1157490 RepID=A0A074M8I2_9BACL|nr:hypothetical protein [Tumebacillus flagellatus]KEO82292.1 hypothetical protein EL26_16035 [Tumebacillus flagellatus]